MNALLTPPPPTGATYYNTQTGQVVTVAPLGSMTRKGMAHELYVLRDAIKTQAKRFYRTRAKYGPDSPHTHRAEAKLFQLDKERQQVRAAFDAAWRGESRA